MFLQILTSNTNQWLVKCYVFLISILNHHKFNSYTCPQSLPASEQLVLHSTSAGCSEPSFIQSAPLTNLQPLICLSAASFPFSYKCMQVSHKRKKKSPTLNLTLASNFSSASVLPLLPLRSNVY